MDTSMYELEWSYVWEDYYERKDRYVRLMDNPS